MKMVKEMALVALGMGAVLAYQKYNEPVKECVKKKVNKTAKMVDDALEDMM